MEIHPPTRIIQRIDGLDYLERWELRGNHPIFDVYLHRFVRSDERAALHDHPAASVSVVLFGSYTDWMGDERRETRRVGEMILRRAATPHRIEIDESQPPPVTIFVRGPKIREWGFHCVGGWRHHKEFHIRGCDS